MISKVDESEIEKLAETGLPSQILDLMLDVIIDVMRAERGSIMLLDEKGEELTIHSSRGLKNDIIKKARVRLGSGISGKVAASGQSIFLKGPSGEKTLDIKPEEMVNPGIDTSCVIPIVHNHRTLGTINVNSTQSNHEILAEKEKLVQNILSHFAEYLGQVELPKQYYETPSQLYMMNIFQDYNMLRELRVVFDFVFYLITDILGAQKKGIFMLKNSESDYSDLVLGYGFDTTSYRDIYEELVPCLKKPRVESARNITIFNRKDLFSAPASYFKEDFYVLMPIAWQNTLQGHLMLFASEQPKIDDTIKGPIQVICQDAARAIAESASGQKLHDIAFTDSLTGTYNYGLWWKRFHEEFSRMERLDSPGISVLVFDIDQLDRLNEEYGYITGDHVLRIIADRIKSCLRINDILGRIGGDEFGIVLPDTPKKYAIMVAERILRSVSGIPEEINLQFSRPFTLSGGVAGFPEDADTPEKLVEGAKTAIISAKISGGNRIKSIESIGE